MENNNGKGIFYGVIGIATLIVAIVGATFAYFTATVQSDEGAINVTSYSGFSISLSMNKIAPELATPVNKLIPLDTTLLETALAHKDINGASQPCVDINGDQVCAIYEIKLSNNGSEDTEVVGYLSADMNTYQTTNLKYQMFECADSEDGDTVADIFTKIGAGTTFDAPTVGLATNLLPKFVLGTNGENEITLAGKAEGEEAPSKTLCLVMWLAEAKDAMGNSIEQNVDQGKTFAGKVTFNAAGSGEKLEASFN